LNWENEEHDHCSYEYILSESTRMIKREAHDTIDVLAPMLVAQLVGDDIVSIKKNVPKCSKQGVNGE